MELNDYKGLKRNRMLVIKINKKNGMYLCKENEQKKKRTEQNYVILFGCVKINE